MNEPRLSKDQAVRYERHLALAGIGAEGQRRLLGSSALVVGAGGLGSPAILYLAAVGVGRLGILDDEQVELSNLNRQVIHRTADVGRPVDHLTVQVRKFHLLAVQDAQPPDAHGREIEDRRRP